MIAEKIYREHSREFSWFCGDSREFECVRRRTEFYQANKTDGNMEQEEDHLITDFRLTQEVWKAASRSYQKVVAS